MLDIGFRPDIEKILRRCPEERQTLLLSATVPTTIFNLAKRYMYRPRLLNFSSKQISADTIDQYYFTVEPHDKMRMLMALIDREDPKQGIIFCRTKRGTEKLYQKLSKRLKNVGCIHGDLNQSQRDRVMLAFREEKIQILLATDVVGRGIDVSTISHIINYDLPHFSEDYVHRVGRTGRMGREGIAFSFVTPEEGEYLTNIEIMIDKLLKRDQLKDFKPREKENEVGAEEDGKPAPKPFDKRGAKRYRKAL